MKEDRWMSKEGSMIIWEQFLYSHQPHFPTIYNKTYKRINLARCQELCEERKGSTGVQKIGRERRVWCKKMNDGMGQLKAVFKEGRECCKQSYTNK